MALVKTMKFAFYSPLFVLIIFAGSAFAQISGGLPPNRKDQPPSKPLQVDYISLLNQGWSNFIGRDGIVNEREALDLTIQGIEKANNLKDFRSRDVGLNNLRVFYRCAHDKGIRDFAKTLNTSVGLDPYSFDNYLWDVFFRRVKLPLDSRYIELIKEKYPNHATARYLATLNDRLPNNIGEAYMVVEQAAKAADHEAAARMAYRYECGEEEPDFYQAIRWYNVAIQALETNGKADRIKSLQTRRDRLILIIQGKIK